MKDPQTLQVTPSNDSRMAWMTHALEQDVIAARERHEQQMKRTINRGLDDTNLRVLADQEMALLDLREAEARLATHIQDLEHAAAVARISGDETQAIALFATRDRAARLLASRKEEAPAALGRLRVLRQAVTQGRRSGEDSTTLLRRLREGRLTDE